MMDLYLIRKLICDKANMTEEELNEIIANSGDPEKTLEALIRKIYGIKPNNLRYVNVCKTCIHCETRFKSMFGEVLACNKYPNLPIKFNNVCEDYES